MLVLSRRRVQLRRWNGLVMRAILSFVLPVVGLAFLMTLLWRSRRRVAQEVAMIRGIGALHRQSGEERWRRQYR